MNKKKNFQKRRWLVYSSDTDVALSEKVFALINQHVDTLRSVTSAQKERGQLNIGEGTVLKLEVERTAPFSMDSKKHYTDPHNLTRGILWLFFDANPLEKAKLSPLVRGLRTFAENEMAADAEDELASDMKKTFDLQTRRGQLGGLR